MQGVSAQRRASWDVNDQQCIHQRVSRWGEGGTGAGCVSTAAHDVERAMQISGIAYTNVLPASNTATGHGGSTHTAGKVSAHRCWLRGGMPW